MANAAQIGWRQRRKAIGKKGAFDADLVIDSEQVEELTTPVKEHNVQTSPSSVAALFAFDDGQSKMMPLVLPGAWTVVGKKGKPVAWAIENDTERSSSKIQKKKKKKKTTKTRARLSDAEEVSVFADLEEKASSSSSTCMRQLDRSVAQQSKARAVGLEAKYWTYARKQKKWNAHARDVHVSELAANGHPWQPWESVGRTTDIRPPEPLKTRLPKHMSSKSEKARRSARKAGMAARCFWPDTEEQLDVQPLVQRSLPAMEAPSPAQVQQVIASASSSETHSSASSLEKPHTQQPTHVAQGEGHSRPKKKTCLIM